MLKWLRGDGRPKPASEPPAAPAPAPPRAAADDLMRKAFPLHQAGDVAGAVALYREILAIDPEYADAHYLLGCAEKDAGRPDEALPHLRRALRSNSTIAAFHQTLGETYYALGAWDEAIVYLQNALERGARGLSCWTHLGCACEKLGRFGEAARHFERAVELFPESPQALNNCAMSLKDRGRVDEAIPLFRKARALQPDDPDYFSNYLYALNYSTTFSAAEIHREHLAFDAAFGRGRFPEPLFRPGPRAGGRLRIGYLSADLRAHPVHVFVEPVLAHHDRAQFEVHAYYTYPWRDAVSERLRGLCDAWVDCAAWPHARLAEQIAADGIDILVDLAGHTGDNRLPVLGRKPAPVIATWLGYPNTTGLRTVDYRITDGIADPPGLTDGLHTEALLRLPHAQWCFLEPDLPVDVTPLPAARGGAVCFASFNHPSKLNDATLRLWAEVLQRVPGSRLLLWGLGEEQGRHTAGVLGAAGLEPARLEFVERTGFRQQLEVYQRVDIALDTHPYSGVTTTFNSLWMGVPVLTLAGGDRLSARTTLSIQHALGLSGWSAATPAEFVELATRRAADLDALAALRAGLRQRLRASALMDAPAFTRSLEAAYRQMWTTYTAAPGTPPS